MGIRIRHILAFAAVITLLAILVLPPKREKAILFARSGDMSKAEALYEDLLKNHPDDTVAILELAEGFMRVGDATKAEKLLALFRAHHKDLRPYLVRLARIYASGYFYDQAISLLSSDPVKFREELIRLCIAAGRNDDAVKYLRLRLNGTSKDLAVWQEIETLQQWQMNLAGVGEALENIARISPTVGHIADVLDFYFWRNNPQKIREYANLLAGKEKLTLIDLRLLRTVWLKLLDLPEALKTARLAVARSDAASEDFLDLVTIHIWAGDPAAADRVLAEGLKKFPASTTLLWQGINLALNRGDRARAAGYQETLARLIGDPALLRGAIENYLLGGKNEQALVLLQKLTDSPDSRPADLLRLAQLYQTMKQPEEAKRTLQKLYALLNPDDPDTVKKLSGVTDDTYAATALLLEQLGNTTESKSLLQHLARRGNLEAQYQLAQLYVNEHRYADALLLLQKLDGIASGDLRRRAAYLAASLKVDAFYLAEDRAREATAAEQKKKGQTTAGPAPDATANARAQRRSALRSTPAQTVLATVSDNAAPVRSPEQRMNEVHDIIDTVRTAFSLAQEFPPTPELEAETRRETTRLREALVDFLLLADLPNDAAAELDKLENPQPALIIEVAARLAENGDKAKALALAEQVKSPETLEAALIARLGGVWLDAGKPARALTLLRAADEKTKHNDKPIRLQLARALGATGDKTGQYAILDDYAHRPEAAVSDWLAAADARSYWDEPETELAILQEGGRRFPTYAVIAARCVSLLAGMGYEAEAKAEAWRLNGLKLKKEISSLLIAAYALMDVQQLREADRVITIAEAVAKTMPNGSPDVILVRARWLAANRDLRKALLGYHTYLEKRADDPAAWYELALLRKETGQYGSREAAFRSRELLLAEDRGAPGWSASDFALASGIADFLGQRLSALNQAQAANQKLPAVPSYGMRLANLYNAYGKYPRAASLGERELRFHPQLSEPERIIATARTGERKYPAAETALHAYLKKKPEDTAARTDLASVQAEQGHWHIAVENLRKAEIMEEELIRRDAERMASRTLAPADILQEDAAKPTAPMEAQHD